MPTPPPPIKRRGHWGKAGVRLTDDQVTALHAKIRTDRNRDKLAQAAGDARIERSLAEAKRMWQAGLVRPAAISFALDAKGLYGPEVDTACLAAEPDVDMWERGALYPTWEQLVALAELTGNTPRFFCMWDNPVPFEATTLRFHVPEFDAPPLVWEFPPDVVAATVGRAVAGSGPVPEG
jgi:hypothetical protein